MSAQSFGSYRAIQQLGAGGMGIVYLAEHALIGRRVAVKVLRPELTGNREIVDRFLNEARATTGIQHPGLVNILDLGHAEGGGIYIVMELLEGETLAARLAHERTLPPAVAADIARQVAHALGAAHEHGIVHRDLKPDNVFLLPRADSPSGVRVKVIDFGIAKLLDAAVKLTRTGTLMGTPVYMSPEQCRADANINHRTDVYSLGCMLFEMVVGRPPYGSKTQAAGVLVSLHLFEPVPQPPPEVPPRLAATIRRALAKNPDERQQSMAELARELEEPGAAGARRAEAPTVMAMAAVTTTAPVSTVETAATLYEPPPPARPRRALRIALVALVATAIGLALLLALR